MFVDWCAETGAENQELLVLPILISLGRGKDATFAEHLERMYARYHNEMAALPVMVKGWGFLMTGCR